MTLRALEGTMEIDKLLPATFTAPGLSEAEFLELCARFPDATVEYTSDGTVIVMPPTDPENGASVHEVGKQLGIWRDKTGRGIVLGPDAGFRFRDGSRRSPDAAWFDRGRWREAKQAAKPGQRFPVFAPDFVIEIRSPDDRVRKLREKMEEYIANGVQFAWLIDPQERTVSIYRAGQSPQALDPEVLSNPAAVAGEGPVAGFVLHLERVFDPLGSLPPAAN
jgi:Uma2 family endonuclease